MSLSIEKIKPLRDRVLVKPVSSEVTTPSGLYIPVTAQERPFRGEVLAVGAGDENGALTVKAGDMVIHNRGAGIEVSVGGDTYLIMRENEILAII